MHGSLAGLGGAVGALLKDRKHTIAVSESSAGGLINAALVAVPGASAYYVGGGVVYTVAGREALLRLDRAKEAQGAIAEAVTYFRRMELKPYLTNALSVVGDVAEALGDAVAAAEAREEAASLRDEIKLPPPLAQLPQVMQA